MSSMPESVDAFRSKLSSYVVQMRHARTDSGESVTERRPAHSDRRPLLTMCSFRQSVATDRYGFRLFFRASPHERFATGSDRLQPRGSIKAPSDVVSRGYVPSAGVTDGAALRG